MFTISAKIFYAAYAILIISPRFGIAYKQLCLDVSCNNSSSQQFRLGKSYLFGLEIVCVFLCLMFEMCIACCRCSYFQQNNVHQKFYSLHHLHSNSSWKFCWEMFCFRAAGFSSPCTSHCLVGSTSTSTTLCKLFKYTLYACSEIFRCVWNGFLRTTKTEIERRKKEHSCRAKQCCVST